LDYWGPEKFIGGRKKKKGPNNLAARENRANKEDSKQ